MSRQGAPRGGDRDCRLPSLIYPYAHGFSGGAPFFTAQRLIVERNGLIDANVKGFASTNGPGAPPPATYAGGSYGGQGGNGKPPYGSYAAPTLPGSGAWLVAGGGLVWMEIAADVTINGAITANGAQSTGGSSGGGVYLTCETLAGAGGMVTANGGNGFSPSGGRAGGGGRVAIIYDPEAQGGLPVPDILFQAAGGITVDGGGKATGGSVAGYYGDLGTLYFPDNRFLRTPLIHSGQWMAPGLTEWAVDRLTVTNAWFRFPHPDFALTVTNDIVITGRDPFAHGLQVVDGNVVCGGDVSVTNAGLSLMRGDSGVPSRLTVGGDLRLEYAAGGVTGGVLCVYATATNGTMPGYGAKVSVGEELAVSTYATIYPVSHSTNGATALFDARDFTLAASGRVDARWRGFERFQGPGAPSANVSPINSWGASYGGVGGCPGNGNPVYGSSNAPVYAGSGGSMGTGGGSFRLTVARTLTLDGVIWADGGGGSYWNASAGSGGGVHLVCKTFAGNGGAIQAGGGTTGTSTASGSGGGGRIAVWRRFDTSVGLAGNVTAPGGPGKYPGQDGTVVWGWLTSPGTVLLLR